MRGRLLLTLGLLCSAARPAAGAEIVLGWDADLVWNSNVFGTADQTPDGENIPKESDFSLRTGPDIRVRERRGDLRYEVSYRPRYEEFFRLNGISEFDQFASGEGRWQINDTTEIHVSDDFGYTSAIGGLFENVPEAVGTIAVTPTRDRITTNTARVGSVHRLGPLWELRFDGTHDLFAFDNPVQSDSFAIGGTAQLTRGITPRLVTGAGVQVQRQEFSGRTSGEEDTGTTFYQLFGVVNYRISPTWNISVNAGPAFSQPDAVQQSSTFTVDQASLRTTGALVQNPNGTLGLVQIPVYSSVNVLGVDPRTCPQRDDGSRVLRLFPQRNSDFCALSTPASGGSFDSPFVGDDEITGELTYFGRVTIDKTWRNWFAAFSYQRSANNGSGLGNSTTLDLVNGQVRWTPSTLWTVTLVGTMSRQTAANEVRQVEIVLEPVLLDFGGGLGFPAGRATEVTTGDSLENSLDIRQYRVELRAERRITRNLTVDGSGAWWQQRNQSGQLENTRKDWRFVMGVTWTFDPIPL